MTARISTQTAQHGAGARPGRPVALFEGTPVRSAMSDFDPEAEREKLREQFAQDQERRATTERMSQLLLQGATMTDSHCETCGDPIFRYDGQEFCPSCQAGTDGQDAAGTAEQDGQGPAEPASGDEGDVRGQDGEAPDPGTDRAEQRRTRRGPDERTPDPTRAPGPDGVASAEPTPADPDTTRSPAEAGELGTARAALERTVTRLATAAEACEDPDRTREYLAGAKEAAEALAAVRDASR